MYFRLLFPSREGSVKLTARITEHWELSNEAIFHIRYLGEQRSHLVMNFKVDWSRDFGRSCYAPLSKENDDIACY